MKLTKMEEDLRIHQKLDDEPNDVGGLTAQELKAKFDQAGLAIQNYLNETHLPEEEAAVEDALKEAKEYTDEKVMGLELGDMKSTVYDTRKRQMDVFEYADAKAREAREDTTRQGYICGGNTNYIVNNSKFELARPAALVDPKGIWPEGGKKMIAPPGAKMVVVMLRMGWARQIYANNTISLKVNGKAKTSRDGPVVNNGIYVWESLFLLAEVEEGDEVTLELYAKKGATSADNIAEITVKDVLVEFIL